MLDDSLADTQPFNADRNGRVVPLRPLPPAYDFTEALNAFDTRYAEIHAQRERFGIVPNTEQWRFLLLHARNNVTKWQWHFRDTILRAYTDNGDTATISAGSLEELLLAGVMAAGAGCADVTLTMRGMEMAQQ